MINIPKKIKESLNSREYQKTLAAFRVYYEFITQQRRYSNIIITIFSLIIFAAFIGAISKLYLNPNLNMIGYITSIIFYVGMIVAVLVIAIWEQYHFKIFKPILVILKNKVNISVLIIVFIIFLISIFASETPISIVYFISLIVVFFIEGILVLIVLSVAINLRRSSLITFSIEQFNNIKDSKSNNEKHLNSKFQLFYYAIYVYYKRLSKDIKEVYKENVENIIGLRYILVLASQIFYNDSKYRSNLYRTLVKLEKIDPILDNKEFMKVIKKIRTDFNKIYFEVYNKEPDESIFFQRSTLGRIKSKTIILLTIVSLIIANVKLLLNI